VLAVEVKQDRSHRKDRNVTGLDNFNLLMFHYFNSLKCRVRGFLVHGNDVMIICKSFSID
jgi:hypothetical protein